MNYWRKAGTVALSCTHSRQYECADKYAALCERAEAQAATHFNEIAMIHESYDKLRAAVKTARQHMRSHGEAWS